MKWDHAADAKLLAAVIRIHRIKLDYDALAAAIGDGCTAKALKHRFARLKNVANGTDTLDKTPTTTPAKRGRPRKNAGLTAVEDQNEAVDDEEDYAASKKRGVKRAGDSNDEASPSKKRSKNGAKATAKKEEDVDKMDEGEDTLPLGAKIKIEDGTIKLDHGEED